VRLPNYPADGVEKTGAMALHPTPARGGNSLRRESTPILFSAITALDIDHTDFLLIWGALVRQRARFRALPPRGGGSGRATLPLAGLGPKSKPAAIQGLGYTMALGCDEGDRIDARRDGIDGDVRVHRNDA